MTKYDLRVMTVIGGILLFVTFSCTGRQALPPRSGTSLTVNGPVKDEHKPSRMDTTEVEKKQETKTSSPETSLSSGWPSPSATPATEIMVLKSPKPRPKENSIIEQASILPPLARLQNTRKNPFLTRGHMALLLSALPGIPIDEKSAVIIMTDIFNNPAKDSILSVVRSGYMNVFPNHQFKPQAIVTRAELADSISRLLTRIRISTNDTAGEIDIPDLPSTNRYYLPVRHVVSRGVMNVRGDGKFNSAEPVTGSEGWEIFLRLHSLIIGQNG